MKIVVILICFALFAAGLINYWAESEPGYLYISWFGYSVEMTVWLFLVSFFALLFVGFFLFKLCFYMIRLPFNLHSWVFSYDDSKLQSQTAHALAAYEEGHWQRAKKGLLKVAQRSKNPLVFYLMAAKASHALGEKDQANDYLKQAALDEPSASMATSLTQAQLQLADGALESCIATLVRAKAIDDEHPQVVLMLAKVYAGLEDWHNLYQLLPQFKRIKLDDRQYYSYLTQAACGLLQTAAKTDVERLMKQWRQLNDAAHALDDVILVYAELLMALKRRDEAFKALKSFLSVNQPSAKVLLTFVDVAAESAPSALQFVQKIADNNQPSTSFFLSLSRLALLNKLEGQYKSYLTKAIEASHPTDEPWLKAQLVQDMFRQNSGISHESAMQQLALLINTID